MAEISLINFYIELISLQLDRGDINGASNTINEAFEITRENPDLWFLRGKIALEKHNYPFASSCFKQAKSLDLDNPLPLLWDSYVRFLNAELYYASDKSRYMDMVISIIRDLEKILDTENNKLKLYTFYLIGYFYYKIDDNCTSNDKLKSCIDMKKVLITEDGYSKEDKDLEKIYESADQLMCNIWSCRMKPNFWDWWVHSPKYHRRFQVGFVLLGIFVLVLFVIHPFLYIFEINWTLYFSFIVLLLSIILFPSLTRIKGGDMEIEIQVPPSLEISAGKIEYVLQSISKMSPGKIEDRFIEA